MKIAIIGPPGAGKTTFTWRLCYLLKVEQKHVELVPEMIKYKVHKGLDLTKVGFDIQNTLEQQEMESGLSNAIPPLDYIVCEAPLCNGYFYASFYKKEAEASVLKKIALENINDYDLIVKLPPSSEEAYVGLGRKEDYEKSLLLDKHILKELKKLNYKNHFIEVDRNSSIEVIKKIALIEEGENNVVK